MKDFRTLNFWIKSMDLATEIYKLVKLLPKNETYALSDQMRRAAVSIPSNIAEGYGRGSTREYIQFLNIARGSCFELDTQLHICMNIGYLTQDNTKTPLELLSEIGKMLTSTINTLKTK